MNESLELGLRAVVIGVGATLVMDVWALLLKRCFHIPSLNYAMVGRWLGHIPQGRWQHVNIAQAQPITGESLLGWLAHYVIGVLFAGLLLLITGLTWAHQPTIGPAILFGLLSVAAPFFILQPGMGAGIAAAKTPQPNTARGRSLMAHLAFGFGLYVAAWAGAYVW